MAVRDDLLAVFAAGVDAVCGEPAVYRALQEKEPAPEPVHVIAIGKAAEAMFQGAQRYLQSNVRSALLISKYDHFATDYSTWAHVTALEAAHPVPDDASIEAGQALLRYLHDLPANETCLFLISGGASSLVEVLPNDMSLAQLQALTSQKLADGSSIAEINALRRDVSQIKGGKLWQFIGERQVQCLLISDVQGDDPAVIGSGLLFPPTTERADTFDWQIVASNEVALLAMQEQAKAFEYDVQIMPDFLEGGAVETAQACVAASQQAKGKVLLWGGETTVLLPENPGRGGRNQHVALAAAMALAGKQDAWLLAAGTDGSDGVSDDTGALVDGATVQRAQDEGLDAATHLQAADAGTLLDASGDLIHTGATGTNVMDVVIGYQA